MKLVILGINFYKIINIFASFLEFKLYLYNLQKIKKCDDILKFKYLNL